MYVYIIIRLILKHYSYSRKIIRQNQMFILFALKSINNNDRTMNLDFEKYTTMFNLKKYFLLFYKCIFKTLCINKK